MDNKTKLNKDIIIYILIAVLTAVITLVLSRAVTNTAKATTELLTTDNPEITNDFISNKLEGASELTAAQFTYNGIITYSDGKIPFITKKSFLMTYRSEVEAGINLNEADIKVTPNTVQLTLPQVDILDVYVYSDSIKFFDENYALFNHENKSEVLDAIDVAKADVIENGDIEMLKSRAQEQTEFIMENLFKDAIGDRELIINYK